MNGPEERLELVAGEVLVKMSPQGSRHSTVIGVVLEALRMKWSRQMIQQMEGGQ